MDDHLNALAGYVINGWPSTTVEVKEEIVLPCPFHDNMTVIDGTLTKGRRTVIPATLQQRALEQLHVNYMDIEKQDNWQENPYFG